jgi:hypothetical protein
MLPSAALSALWKTVLCDSALAGLRVLPKSAVKRSSLNARAAGDGEMLLTLQPDLVLERGRFRLSPGLGHVMP